MRRLFVIIPAVLALCAGPPAAEAQFKKLKQKLERKVERKLEQKVDKAMDDVVNCAFGDTECIRKAESDGKQVQVVNAQGQPVPPEQQDQAVKDAKAAPGEGIWRRYDFVPGERVLYTNDFSRDEVGDFPRRLDFEDGNMEVVEWRGENFLFSEDHGYFSVALGEPLPERFTIEFDYAGKRHHNAVTVYLNGSRGGPFFAAGELGAELRSTKSSKGDAEKPLTDQLIRARFMIDGTYAKAYVNSERVAQVPNFEMERSNKLYFTMAPYGGPVYIKNISINAGGREMYDAIEQEGRYVTQGIFFDTDSDRLRPESTPTLKKIGRMLEDHEALKLAIEGHTDSRGDDDHNMDLSTRRAASVRRYLLETYDVEPERLTADGHGEKQPAAENDTPEGRQQNRRVELVKRS